MSIITKALIGQEDFSTGSGTFTRSTSTGGTGTLTKIGAGALTAGNLYNIRVVDGVKFTTIQAAINDLPSTGGRVLVPPGTYAQSDIILNKANVEVIGCGNATVITPSGGVGHYGFILGDANPSTVSGLQLRNLSITGPGDGTSGVLVHKGVSIGTVLEKLKIRQCATHILWGDQTGGTQSAFSGMIRDCDIDLVGTQIGIDLNVGPAGSNGANGITIEGCAIRNGTLNSGASIGIRVNGQAARTSIINNYIEYMPGGCIVLRNTYSALNRVLIAGNYMETLSAGGLLLDIGNGVSDVVFQNNYTNQATTPSNFAIKIANGATNIYIANNTFQNEATAVINNLNVSASAAIVLYNNDHSSGSAPWFDSATGIIQQDYVGAFTTQQTNPVCAIKAYNAGAGKQLQLLEPSSGATQLNWRMGASFVGANLLDFTPSTTNGGATYSTAAMALGAAGIAQYNGVNTVSNGIPVEYATVDLTAQTAAVGTTTLYAVPSTGAGQYRVSWNAKVTTAAGTSSTLGALTITYTDPDGVVQTITAAAQVAAGTIATTSAGNTTATVLLGVPLLLNCKASTNIQYAFAYASNAANAMNYNLHIKAEAL